MSIRLRRFVKYGAIEGARWLVREAKQTISPSERQVSSGCHIAIISDRDAWCSEQQLNPFVEFEDELLATYGIQVTHMYLDALGVLPPLNLSRFDAVLVKLSYRTTEQRAVEAMADLRARLGDRPLIYMDGDDDLCIQWGEVVEICDLYVKCHAFADRSQYLRRYVGKSNLHEYAVELHGHALCSADYSGADQEPLMIHHSGVVAHSQLPKIAVGWNMAYAPDIRALRQRVATWGPMEKTIACAFRGSVKQGTITQYMRGKTLECLRNLAGEFNITVSSSHISRDEFYRELAQTRICVSPFGFGELCWRDFEAVLCRSLLIKPDMSHIETEPDIFQANETYVPVKWDLSDLEEKCRYYLNNEQERLRITENAFRVLDEYYRTGWVTGRIRDLLVSAGLPLGNVAHCR